jgi:hypothetical protein
MFIPSFGIYKIGGSGSGSPVNTIYSADDTIASARNVGLSTLPLTFGTSIFSMQGANGRIGVGTANAFTGQVTYASDSAFASYFVVRTASDRYGLNHNNGTVELASYITSTASSFGTTTNHPLQFYTNDSLRGAVLANGNFSFGTISDLSARVGIQGIDSTSANFAAIIQNSSNQEMFSVRNDGYSIFGKNLVGGTADLITIDPSDLSFGFGINGGWGSSEFLIRSTNTYNTVFNVRDNGGSNLFIIAKSGSDIFGNTWSTYASVGTDGSGGFVSNWKDATYGAGYVRLTLDGNGNDGLYSQSQNIWDVGSPSWLNFAQQTAYGAKYLKIDSIKGLITPNDLTGYAAPYLEIASDDADSVGSTLSGKSRISSIGHSYIAVNTGPQNDFFGVGTDTPTSKLQVVGLPTYADNAAALAGGLTAGAMYIRTGHGLDIVV